MFWSDDSDKKQEFVVPDDVVDIAFKLECRMLPLDHAQALSDAIASALPWFMEEDKAGLHLVHVAESGNGWYRPEDPENEVLCLSRRTRMTLRVPRHRIEDAQSLTNRTLDVDGNRMHVGEATIRLLSSLPTMFARYVVAEPRQDEHAFLRDMAAALRDLDIPVNKLMAGMEHVLNVQDGPIHTRSLMVAELAPEHAVKLQQEGIGPGRKFGCGLFLPQKGIASVKAD